MASDWWGEMSSSEPDPQPTPLISLCGWFAFACVVGGLIWWVVEVTS